MQTNEPNRRGFLRGATGIGLGTSIAALQARGLAEERSVAGRGLSPLRYEELRPAQFDEALKYLPVCYVPVGVIEWHGEHLPLGTDGMRVQMILERASERFGGIVHPPIYSGVSAAGWDGSRYKYNGNATITLPTYSLLIRDIVAVLKGVGFQGIILLSGHAGSGQIPTLQKVANELADDRCHVWADGDHALGGRYKLEHAGFGETSFLLYGRPKFVRVESLKERGSYGITKDPNGSPAALRATAAEGDLMVESAVEGVRKILVEWKLLPSQR